MVLNWITSVLTRSHSKSPSEIRLELRRSRAENHRRATEELSNKVCPDCNTELEDMESRLPNPIFSCECSSWGAYVDSDGYKIESIKTEELLENYS